jgi:nucleotide-binding universal stress UspA family protein
MTPRRNPSTAMTHKISLLFLLALAACGDDAEKTAQRTAAHRAACVAEELAIQANTKVSALDTLRTRTPGGFVDQVYPFSRAYFDYAKLRERHAALLDSAAAAESAQDSVRFTGEAARNAPRPGEPGSTEANAAESYERDYAAAISNPDHPCNQQGGEEEK